MSWGKKAPPQVESGLVAIGRGIQFADHRRRQEEENVQASLQMLDGFAAQMSEWESVANRDGSFRVGFFRDVGLLAKVLHARAFELSTAIPRFDPKAAASIAELLGVAPPKERPQIGKSQFQH